VAALIAVQDERFVFSQSPIHRMQDEWKCQGLIKFPSDHKARKPIQDGYQVHPAPYQANVGDIDTPYLVRSLDRVASQQIGIYLVLWIALTQFWPRANTSDRHFTHVSLNSGARYLLAFPPQDGCNPSRSIHRILCVNFIDTVLQGNLSCRWSHRLIVKTCSAQSQQFSLFLER